MTQLNSSDVVQNKVANIEKELDMVGKEIVCIKSRKQEMELKAEAEHEKNKAAEKEREKAKKDLLKMVWKSDRHIPAHRLSPDSVSLR